MRLADLVDLEVQLARDASREEEARARDAALGVRLLGELAPRPEEAWARIRAKDPRFRRALVLGWVQALRERDDTLPGRRIERGQRLVGILLALLAILLGGGAMQAVLGVDRAVNVTHFVGWFVLLQVALVALLLLVLARARRPGWFPRLIRALSEMKWVDRFVPTHARRDVERLASGLETHGLLYAGLERWSLFAIAQRFASLFLLAALATYLAHVTFTHLTFGWATTLDLEPRQVHAVARTLALPWAPFLPDAVPDLALVEASRNSLERVPGTEAWWRFLALALVTWGLLPRIAFWAYGRWRVQRETARLDLSQRSLQRLYDRLLQGSGGWEGRPEEAPRRDPRERPRLDGRTAPSGTASVVRWRNALPIDDDLRRLAHRALALDVAPPGHVAGTTDVAEDERALAALGGDADGRPVVVVAEGGDAPTKDLLHFLSAARERVGPQRELVVLLLDRGRDGTWRATDEEDLAAWRHFLETASDPHLRVERCVP